MCVCVCLGGGGVLEVEQDGTMLIHTSRGENVKGNQSMGLFCVCVLCIEGWTDLLVVISVINAERQSLSSSLGLWEQL